MRFDVEKIAALLEDKKLNNEVYDKLKEHYPEDVLQWVKDADWTLKSIPLSEINMSRRPGGRNMDKVKGIAKAVEAGEKMDPVVLVKQSDGKYQVADGYHRTLGFQHAGKDKIKAYVADCGCDDGPWDKEMHEKKLNVEPGKKASETSEGLAKLALNLKNFVPSFTGERLRSLQQGEQALLDETERHYSHAFDMSPVKTDLFDFKRKHQDSEIANDPDFQRAYDGLQNADDNQTGTLVSLQKQRFDNIAAQKDAERDQHLARRLVGATGLGLAGAGAGGGIYQYDQQKEANEMNEELMKLADFKKYVSDLTGHRVRGIMKNQDMLRDEIARNKEHGGVDVRFLRHKLNAALKEMPEATRDQAKARLATGAGGFLGLGVAANVANAVHDHKQKKEANDMGESMAKLALNLGDFLPSLTGERLRSLQQAEQALLDERGRHIDNGVPLGVAYDLLNSMNKHKPEVINDNFPLSAAYNNVLRADAKNKGTVDFLKGQIARNLGDQQAAARDQQLSRIIAGSAAGLGLTGAGVGAAIHHHNQKKEANDMGYGLAKIATGEEAAVTDDREQMGLLPRLSLILGSTGVGAGLGHLADRRLGSNPIAAFGGGALGLGASALATAPEVSPEDVANTGRLVLQALLAGQAINDSQRQQQQAQQQALLVQQEKDLAARKANTPPPSTSAGSGGFKTRQSMDKSAVELVIELSKWGMIK